MRQIGFSHCRESPDRPQAKQIARPLCASHSAATVVLVAGLKSNRNLKAAGCTYVSVCQARARCSPWLVTVLFFRSGSRGPFCSEPEHEVKSWRSNLKEHSNLMATPKPPLAFGCTRRTVPRALKNMPGRAGAGTPTATSTLEPSGIRKALESKMPPRLMFSEWACTSLWASVSETGR
jgi:hypothetical protein